ncbi:retrovirus-related pol polyprotein from transposon TNT 1-94 [Tanacetum coccineum]
MYRCKDNLFWELGNYFRDGESMESYYSRFYKLMNELTRNNLQVTTNASECSISSTTSNQIMSQEFVTVVKLGTGKQRDRPNQLFTPQSESVSEEDSDPEQAARRDKDMQKTCTPLLRYYTSPVIVQKTGIQCFNCKGFGHYARECRKPKRVKDYAYHKEKMMMCKQAEQGVPLQAEQADWLEDTDEEIDEQELEAHYSYMAKIQEVSPAESSSTDTPLEQCTHMFWEKDDSNVIPVFIKYMYYDIRLIKMRTECVDELLTELEKYDKPLIDLRFVNQKHDELVKKSLLTRSQFEGQLKEKTKVISDLKVKEGKDIDTMIEMDKQIKFLNEILYKRNQSIQTIHMLAPKYASLMVDQPLLSNSAFPNPTAKTMEVLIKTLLMPLSNKTILDSHCFVHELKREMNDDLEYVNSLEKELDELESEKADFSNIYDLLLEECVSKDVTCSYLHSLSDLNANTELQCLYLHKVKECECLAQKLSKQTESVNKEVHNKLLKSFAKLEKHSISLELSLQHCKEQMKNNPVCKENASNVFRKEREQYHEIQDLKAQMQDKNMVINELKKLILVTKGKSVETQFDKPSVVRQPNAQRIPKPSVLGKPTPFSNSPEMRSFQTNKSVNKTNASDGLFKPVTQQNLPQKRNQAVRNTNVLKPGMFRIASTTTQTRTPQLPHASRNTNPHMSKSLGVIHTTSVSRPQLKCYQVKDKVVPNNSQVKFQKKEVEDHHRISSISKKTKSVTACNDSSNSRTSNENAVCAECGTCVFNSNHDACVSRYLKDVNARTKKPNVVPISASKPKRKANKSVATPHKKTVASDTTIQKSKSYYKELYENTNQEWKWWIAKRCPSGYTWTQKPLRTKKIWMPKIRKDDESTSISPTIDIVSRITNIVQLILFIVDSGCTKHMTGNLKLLCNFVEKFLGTVRFGNDQFAPILGYGDLIQGNVTIKRVYYVEGLNHNLFSVGQFCDADLEVAFRKSTCFVRDLQGNDLLTGNRGSDLYTISLQETTSSTPICFMAKASPTQAWLWHRRLSHLNFDYITLLSKKDVVTGLPKLTYVKDQLCSSCEMSKAKRSSFKSKAVPSSKGRLNLLHMDLCGPMRVASINGKKYILVIVDDYSRYTWTLFLRSKDETPEVLKDFLTMIQRNLQAQVITVRTDRGTEFLNKTLHAYFKEEGIEHQTSTPRTPEQNGVVERRNRTLVEAARTMLSASKLPLSFWAEAVATACYTQNRSIIISIMERRHYHIK